MSEEEIRRLVAENERLVAEVAMMHDAYASQRRMLDALVRWDETQAPKVPLQEFPSTFPTELAPGVGSKRPDPRPES